MGSYFNSNQRKLVSALAAAIFVAIGIGLGSAPKVFGKYSGGTGEPNDPYRIATAADLNDIGNYEDDWDKHFILVNDVNLAEYTGTQFKIIGNSTTTFTGVFDGNYCNVWNFTYRCIDRDYIGLFGKVGGQIKNLFLQNVDVNSKDGWCSSSLVGANAGTITNCCSTGNVSGTFSVAGITGINSGSIRNCYFYGSISSNGGYAGGLSGLNSGTITNCYSSGSILANNVAGGLVGLNSDGVVNSCYSTDSVWGKFNSIGGLVGRNLYGTISNCFSSGSISGNSMVGGLAGENWGSIINCYSIGSIIGIEDVGGLVGVHVIGEVRSSFWDTKTSGQSKSAGGTPKTTNEMKTLRTFAEASWDFVNVWGIGEHQTYPYLRFAPAGDLNYDKKVDLLDLAILASYWLEGGK